MQQMKFVFIDHQLHTVVGILRPPNRHFQAELSGLASHEALVESNISTVMADIAKC